MLLVVGFAVAGLLWWLLTLPGEKAHPLPAGRPAAADAARATELASPPAEAGAAPAAAERVVPPTSLRAPVTTGGAAQLEFAFSAASWVEVSDAQGRHLLQGLVEGGSRRTLTGTAPFFVVLGNAPAVRLQFNGEPVNAGTLVRRDGSAHLFIDAAGRVSPAAPRLAHGD
jgi:cytoskeleton protein RodZ